MSHFKVINPRDKKPEAADPPDDNCLSIRSGKMSFVQYGFTQDPGDGVAGGFDRKRVVLLVLNNHQNVIYELESESGTHVLSTEEAKDHVCILWPESMKEPPIELSPKYLFEHRVDKVRGGDSRHWPRESFDSKGQQLEWNAALVYYDPKNEYAYQYHTDKAGRTDDYRFALGSEKIVAWLWEKTAKKPEPLFKPGETVKRAMQAKAGGPQGEGGALPYPPG